MLILLIALYVLVDAVYVPKEEVIQYPTGELVESIFVAQNNEYVKNDSLSNTHSFETIPYKVDVPQGNGAKIGTGTIYQVGNGYFVYVSEYTDQYDIQDIIASQFPVALLINYVPESTRITIQQDREGYINGFKARYLADQLYATDNVKIEQAIIVGYALDVPEGTYFGNHIFVAVGTTTMETQSVQAAAQVLSAVIKTVRYDEQLDKQLVKEAEREKSEREAAQKAAAESEPRPVEGEDTQSNSNVSSPFAGGNGASPEDVSSDNIVVTEDYAVWTLNIEWVYSNPSAVLELWPPSGAGFYPVTSQTDTSAYFRIENITAGTYVLKIKGYSECGQISCYQSVEATTY